MKQNKSKGIIVYRGPSAYDGKPIVAILTKSVNRKVGNSTQLWILRDGVNPIEASRIGEDFSICGNCKHRGKANTIKTSGWADGRTCYVNLLQAPNQVYKSLTRGIYEPATTIDQVCEYIGLDFLRIGAYGDPGALPLALIDQLIACCSNGYTSYTHAYSVGMTLGSMHGMRSMVSVDSKHEAMKHHSDGYRTFRVIPIAQANDALLANEILCPSDRGVQCKDCKLCNGLTSKHAKSIAIIAHGVSRNKITE